MSTNKGLPWLKGKWAFTLPLVAIFLFLALGASSCDTVSDPSAQNTNEANKVNQQQALYQKTQPFPFFNYSTERDVDIQLYEARQRAVDTYTVVYSYGKPIWVCPSKGFPIPYTDQLTNPQAVDPNHDYSQWGAVLPQAEPNGLYTGNTSATWVLCVRSLPGGGTDLAPVYVESDVQTFAFPVKIVDGQVVDAGGASGVSVTINTQAAQNSAQATATPSK